MIIRLKKYINTRDEVISSECKTIYHSPHSLWLDCGVSGCVSFHEEGVKVCGLKWEAICH